MTKLTEGEQTATLDPNEVKLARAEAKELWDAIHAKDEMGAVDADIDSKPGLRAEINGVVDNVKSKWGSRVPGAIRAICRGSCTSMRL